MTVTVRFAGYAAIFDHPDRGGDIIRKGAFDGAKAGLPVFWCHDATCRIGTVDTVLEDDRGLRVTGTIAGRFVPVGQGLSFGYRVRAAATISANGSAIIREAVAKSLLYSDITRPGGNMYTTRRYAACIRDLDYYLRYATYAMLAGDTSILDERVLNGLKETYNSLGVPIGATVQSIQAMKETTAALVGPDAGREMAVYFDYICSGLGN